MELKYRGVSYQPSVLGDENIDKNRVGRHAHRANETGSIKAAMLMPGDVLTYRGVRYSR